MEEEGECEKIHFELHYEGVLIVRSEEGRFFFFSERRDMILIKGKAKGKKQLVDFHFPNYFEEIFLKTTS